MHRSARGGGDVTELGQHALSALKVELSLLCFDKALVQVGDLIFFAIATLYLQIIIIIISFIF